MFSRKYEDEDEKMVMKKVIMKIFMDDNDVRGKNRSKHIRDSFNKLLLLLPAASSCIQSFHFPRCYCIASHPLRRGSLRRWWCWWNVGLQLHPHSVSCLVFNMLCALLVQQLHAATRCTRCYNSDICLSPLMGRALKMQGGHNFIFVQIMALFPCQHTLLRLHQQRSYLHKQQQCLLSILM